MRFLLRVFALPLCWLMASCITDPGKSVSTDFGRGNIRVTEKNNVPARIFLDYQEIKAFPPVTLENIHEGVHTLHLFQGNYLSKPESLRVTVTEKAVVEASFELLKSFSNGTLDVQTVPAGAMVSINNIDFGISPLSISGLPAGVYPVSASLGNLSESGSVTVSADRTMQIDLVLRPKKSVTVEYFSNTNCPPCPAAGAAIDELIGSMPAYRHRLQKIAYHTNFPGLQDPFYRACPDAQKQRMTYYGVAAAPSIFIDGESITWNGQFAGQAKARIEKLLGDSAAAELSFGALHRDSLSIAGSVTVKTSLTGLRLTVSLMEAFAGYETPPGTNGQKSFDNIFRGNAPQADTLVVAPPEQTVAFTFDISNYSDKDLFILAVLDDRGAKKIVQSLRVHAPQ